MSLLLLTATAATAELTLPRAAANGQRGGQIRPDQRDTDDTTPTVVGPGLRPDHQVTIFITRENPCYDFGICRKRREEFHAGAGER